MNTTKYVLGEIYVLFCPDQKQYTLHLYSDEAWYDGRHGITREPQGFTIDLSSVLKQVAEEKSEAELKIFFQIPAEFEDIFPTLLSDVKKVLSTQPPQHQKVSTLTIRSARNILGLAKAQSKPSKEVVIGAAKLKMFLMTLEKVATGRWPEVSHKVHAARQFLLGLSLDVPEKTLLSPLSRHVVLAEPGHVCTIVEPTGFRFGLFAGERSGHKIGQVPVFLLCPGGFLKPKANIPLFAFNVNEARSTIGNPRTLEATHRFDWLGQAFCVTAELLGKLKKTEPPKSIRSLLPGLDPRQVLGIHTLEVQGFRVPPISDLVKLHLLSTMLEAEMHPLSSQKAYARAHRVWAAALALKQ